MFACAKSTREGPFKLGAWASAFAASNISTTTLMAMLTAERNGCCPASVVLLSRACPEYLAKVFASLAKLQEQWRSLTIIGRVKAKAKGPVQASKLRTILPLPAIVAAIDVIVANRPNNLAGTLTADVGVGFLEAARNTGK